MKEHYPRESAELLNRLFPKGDKRRGDALVLMAQSFFEGRCDDSLRNEIKAIKQRMRKK